MANDAKYHCIEGNDFLPASSGDRLPSRFHLVGSLSANKKPAAGFPTAG